MGKKWNTNDSKTPMSQEKMYRFIVVVVLAVASAFFLKNIFAGQWLATVVIGICLSVFGVVFYGMSRKKAPADIKQIVLGVCLCLLIFIISLFSGESYSDDFTLFLAATGMCGLFLEPKLTKVQIILSTVLLVLMYLIHPEKAESLGQYILCLVLMVVAGLLFHKTIKRGRAFLLISQEQTEASEKVLESMRQMGVDLRKDFQASSESIDASTGALTRGGELLSQGAMEIAENCDEVHDRIQVTERQIHDLNNGVMKFEQALNENQHNMEAMDCQMQKVAGMIENANLVFQDMESQMRGIYRVAENLNNISFNITILSLNASIEAARAGDAGSGFNIVAQRMRELSESSNEFSLQVEEAVSQLTKRMEDTSKEFSESIEAIEQSTNQLGELQGSFGRLREQFADLYGNIEEQNSNVSHVDSIFYKLSSRVSEMRNLSEENQNSVEAIVKAMDIYKDNITGVIEQTKKV